MYLAGIVLYNPDIKILKKNLTVLLKQGFFILLVDNASKNVEQIKTLENNSIILLRNERNMGIGCALNQICEFAWNQNIEWVLALDQDSIVPDNLLSEYISRIDRPNLAIICPSILEQNINKEICHQNLQGDSYIEKCITSASFISVPVWEKVGKFDEAMFIDYIDFDYCYKVRKMGYKILKIPTVQLRHSLGESELRKFLFWNVRVGNHVVNRKYYIARNTIIFMRRYKSLRVVVLEILRLFKLLLFTVLYEKDKRDKLFNIAKGVKDGLCWNI